MEKNTNEKKAIAIEVVSEHVPAIIELNDKMTDAIEGNNHEAIIEIMAEIAKLHRRITRPASEAQVTIREDGTKLVGAVTTIACEECGKEHIVKVQDAHQVKRCPDCQKKHRNVKRAEKRKEKRAEVRAQKEADAALAAELLAKYKAEQGESANNDESAK